MDGGAAACYPSGMRLLLALLMASAALAAPAEEDLPAGRYSVQLKGMLCAVCARAIAAEWSKLPAVEKAEVDLERAEAIVTVRLQAALPVKSLRKALKPAARTSNLGARFELGEIRYLR